MGEGVAPDGLGVLDGIAVSPAAGEAARFIRPAGLRGVEALHARFVQHRYPPHVHDTWTIALVQRGAVTFRLERGRHLAPPGSVFLIPPGAVHTGESAWPDGYVYRVLYVPLELIGTSGRGPTVVEDRDLASSLLRVHGALLREDVLAQGDALAGVARRLARVLGSGEVAVGREHPAVRAARAYIHEHWRRDFSLDDLAAAVNLSPFHLVRQFGAEVGMPPSAYRRALRIQAAQHLLRAGEPPASVAARCGFYDQAHLTRHFKRVTGVTPGRYARAGLGGQRTSSHGAWASGAARDSGA